MAPRRGLSAHENVRLRAPDVAAGHPGCARSSQAAALHACDEPPVPPASPPGIHGFAAETVDN